jgi:hypothetical protein
MKNIILISAILLVQMSFAFAQDKDKAKKPFFDKTKYAITASVAHTKDINFFNVIGTPNVFSNPIKPWYAIGLEKTYKANAKGRRYYGVELNYHDYKYVDKSIGITLVGGFEKKIYKGFYAGLGMGLGIQQAKRADIVYTYENSVWEPSVYPGKWQYNRQNVRLSAELGYKLPKYDMAAYIGANIIYVRNPYGADVPLGLYQTPIKIGVRKGLASLF